MTAEFYATLLCKVMAEVMIQHGRMVDVNAVSPEERAALTRLYSVVREELIRVGFRAVPVGTEAVQ